MKSDRRLTPQEKRLFIDEAEHFDAFAAVREALLEGEDPTLFQIALIQLFSESETQKNIIIDQRKLINDLKNEIEKLREHIRNMEKKLDIERKPEKKVEYLILPDDYRQRYYPQGYIKASQINCPRCGNWKWERFLDEKRLKARCINCGHIYGES